MKTSKIINSIFTVMLLFCMVPAINVHAQEQGLRWSKWSEGQRNEGTGILIDKVINSYIDSIGNTYIYGQCGKDAQLGENGPYICPMDSVSYSGYEQGNAQGIYLAKIDSLGSIIWCLSARSSNRNSTIIPWNMIIKEGRITIAFDCYWNLTNTSWLYLFDTLIIGSLTTSPIPGFMVSFTKDTYFITFDMNGNVINRHNIQLFGPLSEYYYSNIMAPSGLGFFDSRFCIDEDNCIQIFATSALEWADSSSHLYLIVDNDTNTKYFIPNRIVNGVRPLSTSRHIKLDSNWNVIYCKDAITRIEGWHPTQYFSTVSLHFNNVLAEDDALYVNGQLKCSDWNLMEDTISNSFQVKVYLDSIHYLRANNLRDFGYMPFLIKLDNNGNIIWVQQIYTDSPNETGRNYYSYGRSGLVVNDNFIYSLCWSGGAGTTFYLDSLHNMPMTSNSDTRSWITCYNKISGSPVDYYCADTLNKNQSESFTIQRDELILDITTMEMDETLSHKCKLCRINKYTKDVSYSFPIYYDKPGVTRNISINSNGWVFRASTGECARVYDSIPVSPTSEASIMTFFYDSSLDMRPKPCPKVDSLWGSTSQHTASIHWSSTFSHTGYELAYMPDGSSWDNATTLETSAATATITLLDDQCYQFSIRGLCDGHRVATSSWSTPITLCPEVGISDVENSSHITISPNPTTGKVTIQGLIEEPLSIELFDITGRLVATFTDTTFDISHLPQGNYIVKVTSAMGNTYHLKLIKK